MATSKTYEKEAVVLRITELKENDGMVTAISKEGLFSFYARGIRKYGSKNGPSCQLLAESKFLLSESNDGFLTLKEGDFERLLLPKEDIHAYAVVTLLLELSTSLIQEEESSDVYPWLYGALTSIAKGDEPYSVGLIYFAHLLTLAGIGLEVDECIVCGSKKKIRSLSYEEGGYVCEDCFDASFMEETPLQVLKMARYFFRAPVADYGRVSFTPAECLPFYDRFAAYLHEMTGTRLRSLELIHRI